MKKVLIVQQIVPEYRIVFFNLLRTELAKENIELSLIYGTNSNSYRSEGNFHELPWGTLVESKTIKIGNIQLYWQPITRHIKDKNLIIVGKSNSLLLNYFLMFSRAFGKIKLGFWGHGRNLQSEENSAGNRFARLFLSKCDWWFAYTNSVKDFLVRNNYPSEKISVVENAIDTVSLTHQLLEVSHNEIKDLKEEFGIIGSNTAIFCGGMYPEKRINFIIESCSVIKKEIPDFHMIFIGSGEDSKIVNNAAASNDWIHYVGPKNGRERVKYFKIASVQLMPGLVGLGVLDSFALETPIVTTNYKYHSPEIQYIDNWKNGVITENTLKDYSKTVIEILRNKRHLELIDGCKQSTDHYSVQNMVENFKKGIVKCLQ